MKRLLRNDLILIGSIVLLSAVVFLVFFLTGSRGREVSVQIDGREVERYSLSEDIHTVINSGSGNDQYNVLQIKDGKASVIGANCRDGICEQHIPISNEGETIVCLPHKVVIVVE